MLFLFFLLDAVLNFLEANVHACRVAGRRHVWFRVGLTPGGRQWGQRVLLQGGLTRPSVASTTFSSEARKGEYCKLNHKLINNYQYLSRALRLTQHTPTDFSHLVLATILGSHPFGKRKATHEVTHSRLNH